MKIIRKITVDKKEREVLDEFFNMCDEDLELLEEDMGSLLRTIFTDCTNFEVRDELYDIEYID